MWECVSVAYKPLTFICAEESNLFPSLSHAQSDSDGNLILNSWKISLFLHSSQSRECNASWCPTDKQIRLNPFNFFSVLRKLHIILRTMYFGQINFFRIICLLIFFKHHSIKFTSLLPLNNFHQNVTNSHDYNLNNKLWHLNRFLIYNY